MGQATDKVQSIYAAINQRDVSQAVMWIDEACCYEDLNFSATFMGRAAVQELFTESCQAVPADLTFVIDDITGDDLAVGVTWHVEINEMAFPNGRGVSFYRFSPESGKLIFARDCVEPALKPGKAAFTIIRWVTPLVRYWLGRQLSTGQEASSNHSRASQEPLSSGLPEQRSWLINLLWAATVVYVGLLLLSPPTWLPGEPIWAVQPDTIQEILDESLNFFFILPLLNLVGINSLPAPTVNPATQGFFNLAEAWIFMFLPLMIIDKRSQHLPRIVLWSLAMFLTNVFLMPYMALRLGQPRSDSQNLSKKEILARLFGALGLIVGNLAVIWFCFNRPELGGVISRLDYLGQQVVSNRVTLAFVVDVLLFWVFQIWLMGALIPVGERYRGLRFIPFWGLGIWLLL
ncbi:MAG: nuclear transport factor 2 family protein [Cyanobacteria bacterium P01_B01_bin.77]